MPMTGESELGAFDGAAALDAAREAVGEDVLSFAEFTADEFAILYVADEVVEMYRDADHLRDHYDQVLSHLHMDFMERDTYERTLLPNAGRVRAIVTRMDEMTLLRMFEGDGGVYVALDPETDVTVMVEAVAPAMRED